MKERELYLFLRTPRSGAFVVSFVDKVTDKARDKALRSLKNLSSAQSSNLNPEI